MQQQLISAAADHLTAKEFATIAALAREQFGLELGAGKEQLAAARLGKLMRKLGFKSFSDYYRYVQDNRTGEALVELIDALTTNHTSFFREQAHFDFLVQRVFAEHKERSPMRIWSAASSTGEEPYTIALTAREHLGAQSPLLPRILATDISTRVLETARKGMYRADRFQDGVAPWLRKHLMRGEGRWEGWYRMRPEILEMVQFQRVNLIEPLPEMGRFHGHLLPQCDDLFQPCDAGASCQPPGRVPGAGRIFIRGPLGEPDRDQHGLQQIQPAIYRKRGGKK